ncbi:MAG: filamentous hemagglutinin N-terminal domain-containing protein [Elainella sp.]
MSLGISLGIMGLSCIAGPAGAGTVPGTIPDIVPDATLPQPSRVTRVRNRTVITDGSQRGSNLFHSFREFSIRSGEAASFQAIDPAVRSVFVRVTGRNASRIEGLLEVQGAANLFLLNPNGILFGRNASLRVAGSFVATSADQITFQDGSHFSAIQPQRFPLLTVSVPTGLQFGSSPGPIVNRSSAAPDLEPSAQGNAAQPETQSGLVGNPRQTLALIGGDLLLERGSSLSSAGGRIELGSVAEAGTVALTPVAHGWEFSYDRIGRLGDIRLLDSQVDASEARGGTIHLQGSDIRLRNSYVFTSSSSPLPLPQGGNLVVRADRMLVEQASFLSTSTLGAVDAGNLLLSTGDLVIRQGGQVSSSTEGTGRGGNIRVNATASVTVAGVWFPRRLDSPLSLLNTVSQGPGPAGNLSIVTGQLRAQAGGQISVNTFGTGDAGNLSIRAEQIELRETALRPNGEPLLLSGVPASSGLFAGTEARGNGGQLTIESQSLSLQDGAILQATTYGSGRAGNITIRAADEIRVSGSSERGGYPARIAATSGGILGLSTPELQQAATGEGGNLDISTDRLVVADRGIVTVNSLNPAAPGAGTIRIQAERVALDNRGQLNAQTESGDQARIALTGVDLLTMRRNSTILTTAGAIKSGGDAGNITIGADLIVNAPAENSDIAANAVRGRGGDITIQSQGILGLAERPDPTPESDITASSDFNVDGRIEISTTPLDPTRAIVELPSTVVDASRLIAQGCRSNGLATDDPNSRPVSQFVITGRGGLPPSPDDLRSSSGGMVPWVRLPEPARLHSASPPAASLPPVSSAPPAPATAPTVEAQGWITTATGQVRLVAQAPALSPAAPHWSAPVCPAG